MARTEPLGSARVDIKANTANFVSQVNRADRAMRDQRRAIKRLRADMRALSRTASGAVKQFVSLRTALGLVIGGGALGTLIRRTTEYGAKLRETADRTGFTIERLQTLGRVFQADGATIEQFNKGLENFLRATSEAAQGVGEYGDAFKLAGVDVAALVKAGADQEKIFASLADGLRNLTNQYDRVGVARDIFGRAGAIFLNQLQRGIDAIKEQERAFAALGLTTEEQADRLKALEQSYTDLSNVLKVAAGGAVAAAADDLARLNQVLAERLPGAIAGVISAITALSRNIDLAVHSLEVIFGFWLVHSRLTRVAAGLRAVAAGAGALRVAVYGAAGAVRFLGRTLRTLIVVEGLITAIKFAVRLADELDQGRGILEAFANAGRSVANEFADLFRTVEQAPLLQPGGVNIPGLPGAGHLDALAASERELTIIEQLNRETRDRINAQRQAAYLVGLEGDELIRVRAENEAINKFAQRRLELIRNVIAAEAAERAAKRASVAVGLGTGPSALEDMARQNQARERAIRLAEEATDAARAELAELKAMRGELDAIVETWGRMAVEAEHSRRIATLFAIPKTPLSDFTAGLESLQHRLRTGTLSAELLRERLDGLFPTGTTALEDYNRALEILNQLLQEGTINAGQFAVAVERLDRLRSPIELSLKISDLRDAFSEFTSDALIHFRDIGDAAEALGRRIETLLIQRLLVDNLTDYLTREFGDIDILDLIPGFARGGVARGLAIVGEEGPELAYFSQPTRIIPNDQLAGLGGLTINQNISVASTDGPGVRRALAEATPAIVDATVDVVQRNLARPSGVRTAARGR